MDEVHTLLNAEPGHGRATAARFDIGIPSADAGVYQMQRMLFVLYRGWVTDSRVWVDA